MDQTIDKITMRKFKEDSLLCLATVERMYLYSEIVTRFGLCIPSEQVNAGVFASRAGLIEFIVSHVDAELLYIGR